MNQEIKNNYSLLLLFAAIIYHQKNNILPTPHPEIAMQNILSYSSIYLHPRILQQRGC